MLKLEILPAGHGDCLWIEYGDKRKPRRILIDGGARGCYKRALARRFAGGPVELELLVVTHVDADHITGVLDLVADPKAGLKPKDVWFNGFRHLPDEKPDTLGPVQGERLTDALVGRKLPWNKAFDRKAVQTPTKGSLPKVTLADGLTLTLLSPSADKLAELRPEWEKECAKAGLDPAKRPAAAPRGSGGLLAARPALDVDALAGTRFEEDDSEANGSSIAFLLEFDGKSLLLAGDAHPGMLRTSLDKLRGKKKLKVTAAKLPHHGSKHNTSIELIEALDCKRYIFSSNGSHFDHPDPEAVARVVKAAKSPALLFNYRTEFNEGWANAALQKKWGYTALFPDAGKDGLVEEY